MMLFILFLLVYLTLAIFSCNKYYFIVDTIIIGVIGIEYLFFNYFTDTNNILIYYIGFRGFIVLITFLIKYKEKELIKINKCNLVHKILAGINIIINLIFCSVYILSVLRSFQE